MSDLVGVPEIEWDKGDTENAYKVLLGRPEGKNPLRRP
jgi:hypothetical protein